LDFYLCCRPILLSLETNLMIEAKRLVIQSPDTKAIVVEWFKQLTRQITDRLSYLAKQLMFNRAGPGYFSPVVNQSEWVRPPLLTVRS